ncbi:MipA/OmpV family protein [Hydrocarboniphaga effusa]|uniref:MipA/OmpV family protein n=1 Tax=Hydrocarboniphaga effusa TaxID=243629 RepID=UPI0031377D48
MLAVLAVPATAFGQQPASPPRNWALGVGAALIDSPYAGEGSRLRPFPLVSYEGERVFLRGISAGVHLYDAPPFRLDALLSPRLGGFDIDDLGRSELLANGVDPELLRNRDDALDAGFRASFGSTWGSIAIEAVHDVSGVHDGYELGLDYRYTWRLAQTAVTASAGAGALSSRLAGYYFGILDSEVARGVPAYSPGSAFVPRIGLTLMHAIGASNWQLLGSIEYQRLPDELRGSPLLEPDRNGMGRVVLGLSRRF